MTELYPSDADIAALSGTADSQQEVLYIATGESPYYLSFYKMLYRLLDVARRSGDLRVYKDGNLTFGVRAGKFFDGATEREFAGASAQALTDNATNYIYLTVAGALTVDLSGFPSPAITPHLPLASITTAGGSYSHSDVVDYRGRCLYRPASNMSPSAANTLTCGGNADSLHLHATAGLSDKAVSISKLANAVTALMPSLAITAGAETSDARAITVQVRDAAGANLAQRSKVRLWLATSDYGAPDATGNTVALSVGTQLRQLTANADYELIANASGQIAISVTISGAATRYLLAEIDGRVYSSGALTWTA